MVVELIVRLLFDNHVLMNLSSIHMAVSVLGCARRCRVPCASFFYNPAQHQCALINQFYEETNKDFKSENGWRYYSIDRDCSQLSQQFSRHPGTYIRFHDDKYINIGNRSVEECQAFCVAQTEFVCRSFDYRSEWGACWFADVKRADVPADQYCQDPYNDYYDRLDVCLYAD